MGARKKKSEILPDIEAFDDEMERCEICQKPVRIMAFQGTGVCCGRCEQVANHGHMSLPKTA